MDDHSQHDESADSFHHHGRLPPVPTSLTTLTARVIIRALKASGHDKAAENIQTLPETIGKALGAPFNRVKNKAAARQPITQQDEQALQESLNKNPQEAATVLGLLLGNLMTKRPMPRLSAGTS